MTYSFSWTFKPSYQLVDATMQLLLTIDPSTMPSLTKFGTPTSCKNWGRGTN